MRRQGPQCGRPSRGFRVPVWGDHLPERPSIFLLCILTRPNFLHTSAETTYHHRLNTDADTRTCFQ